MPSLTKSADQPRLIVNSSSSRFAVRTALETLTTQLSEWGMADEKLSEVELVAAEALNNIVEHACEGKDGVPFSLTATRDSELLRLDIQDEGRAMPGWQLPATAEPEADLPKLDVIVADLPEGGWGWLLIRDLTESLHYVRVGAVNHLTITLPWNCS
ncbi:ATP-binding protein [Primorskyibacter sp. S187A]|uniref:ATP-binding protein n=1 Tax=Primorskyibacter sp. S187A TaxID=3415130 RepID=UPI003C7C7D78